MLGMLTHISVALAIPASNALSVSYAPRLDKGLQRYVQHVSSTKELSLTLS